MVPVGCAGGMEANLLFLFIFTYATLINVESILISPLASIVVTASR